MMETQTYMTISWLMLDNDAQYWSVRTNADDLYDQRNLPKSTLQFIMPGLKINKSLPTPTGIPKEWKVKPATKKREQEQVRERDGREKEREQRNGNEAASWSKETHPKVKEMMETYRSKYDRVVFGQICKKAGVRIDDLPESLHDKCFNHLLGKCNLGKPRCRHIHAAGSSLDEGDVDALVATLKPGVEKVVEDGLEPFRKR